MWPNPQWSHVLKKSLMEIFFFEQCVRFSEPSKDCQKILVSIFIGLVWLTSNQMFGSGDSWDISPSWFLKILKSLTFYSGNFKIFKNSLWQFILFSVLSVSCAFDPDNPTKNYFYPWPSHNVYKFYIIYIHDISTNFFKQ